MNRIGVILIASLFINGVVAAPNRGISVQLRTSEAAGAPVSDTVQLYEKSYALVIGIDNYTGGWPRLNEAVQDAEAVAEGLKAKGFEVALAPNLGSSQLREKLRSFFAIKGSDPNARLLLWFAGHGHTINGEGFLVPADAPVASDPAFKVSALHMRDFGGLVRLAESRHVLSIFDSCFSGTIFTGRAGSVPPAITAKTIKPVRQFLTSGDAGQQVRDDGSYRKLFLRAINGEASGADPNRDGYVTGQELGLYLSQSMADLTQAAQIPKSGKLQDVDYNQGDFVFLASLTESGAPTDTDFSISDLKRQADDARKEWESQLVKMRDAFNMVREIDHLDTPADIRRAAWERFLSTFREDNPYSQEDDSMRDRAASEQVLNGGGFKIVTSDYFTNLVGTDKGAAGNVYKDCDYCPEMVIIPSGQFRMGDVNGGGAVTERPVHQVAVSKPFGMGKYEVTFAEYDVFAKTTGRGLLEDQGWGRGNMPAINVTWEDANAYANWVSEKTGKHYRLPSEAEWEYAARAGTTTSYSWGNDIGVNRANCDGCGSQWDSRRTAQVGSFQPNQFGLYDMSGNVGEWVGDCKHAGYRGAPTDGSSWASAGCESRILRGGGFDSLPRAVRSANRDWFFPTIPFGNFGFRLAQDLPVPHGVSDELMGDGATRRAKESELAEMVRAEGLPEARPVEQKVSGFPGIPVYQTDCDFCPEMILIAEGSFSMGDLTGVGDDDENPVHTVHIDRFYLSLYEVTFAEYDAFAEATKGQLPSDQGWGRGNRPAIDVSWNDAKHYAKWLSNETGKRYRLPSEAEWEYAARSGSTTKYHFGNEERELCKYANGADQSTDYDRRNKTCNDGYGKKTAPVGSFQPNQFGLYDMHGNVWEWVEDCYHKTYQGAPADGTAWTSGNCSSRVLRGGSWGYRPKALRSAFRWGAAGYRGNLDGFRLARDL